MVDAFSRIWSGETVLPEGCELDGPEAGEAAALARGFASLTPQQMNILRLICQGRPNKIISYELSIAEATVKTHIAAIMSKINVRNRTQAALLASKARIFTPLRRGAGGRPWRAMPDAARARLRPRVLAVPGDDAGGRGRHRCAGLAGVAPALVLVFAAEGACSRR